MLDLDKSNKIQGLKKTEISNLAIFEYKNNSENSNDDKTCSICYHFQMIYILTFKTNRGSSIKLAFWLKKEIQKLRFSILQSSVYIRNG